MLKIILKTWKKDVSSTCVYSHDRAYSPQVAGPQPLLARLTVWDGCWDLCISRPQELCSGFSSAAHSALSPVNLVFKSWIRVTSYSPSPLCSLSGIAACSAFLMHTPFKKRLIGVYLIYSMGIVWCPWWEVCPLPPITTREVVMDREAWGAAVHGIAASDVLVTEQEEVDLQGRVSFRCTAKHISYTCTCIRSFCRFFSHMGPSQSTKETSLCCTVGPY